MSSSRAKLKLDNGVIQGARCPSLEEWPCGESLGEADSRAILRRRPQLACVTGAFDLSAGPGTPPGCGHPSFFVKVSGGAMKINRRACGWAMLFSFLCFLLFVSGALRSEERRVGKGCRSRRWPDSVGGNEWDLVMWWAL